MSAKKNVKKIVEFLAIKSAKMACGTASAKISARQKNLKISRSILARDNLLKDY